MVPFVDYAQLLAVGGGVKVWFQQRSADIETNVGVSLAARVPAERSPVHQLFHPFLAARFGSWRSWEATFFDTRSTESVAPERFGGSTCWRFFGEEVDLDPFLGLSTIGRTRLGYS